MDESMIEAAVEAVMEAMRATAPYDEGTPDDAVQLFVGIVSEVMAEARALAETTGVELPPRWT